MTYLILKGAAILSHFSNMGFKIADVILSHSIKCWMLFSCSGVSDVVFAQKGLHLLTYELGSTI